MAEFLVLAIVNQFSRLVTAWAARFRHRGWHHRTGVEPAGQSLPPGIEQRRQLAGHCRLPKLRLSVR
jgi:hypothetical protein